MSDAIFDHDFPGPWPYEGTVLERDDPDGLGRVKLKIPGKLEPSSGWVYPVGMPAAGARGHGCPLPPPVGASVLVFFVAGERESPRYLSGNYGEGEAPAGYTTTPDGDLIVWQDKRVRIEVDSRGPSHGVRFVDRATGGGACKLEVDLAGRRIGLTAALGIVIKALGTVEIDGATVKIAGRVVSPAGPPI